jgi:hypothetical protein
MKSTLLFVFICCSFSWSPAQKPQVIIPTLEQSAGKWMAADTTAMEPSIRNFRGQALVNRDMTSISWFASAPYSGGYHTGVFKINGEVPAVQQFKWQPYQALRKTSFKGYNILSSTRMLPEEDGIVWNIEIINTTGKVQTLSVDIDLVGFISKYGGDWQWWYPFPTLRGKQTTRDDEIDLVRKYITVPHRQQEVQIEELINGKQTGKKIPSVLPTDEAIFRSTKYKTTLLDGSVIVADQETTAFTAFGFVTKPTAVKTYNSGGTATWKFTLQPNQKKVLQYCMVYGDESNSTRRHLNTVLANFNTKYTGTKKTWEDRWAKIFQPHNDLISGCFPTLDTKDTIAKRVYYTGPLTMLYLLNTNMPQQERVILTGGPKWGATISFFWDNAEWAMMQALTDPERLKANISSWLSVDPAKNYGFDNFGGKGVGNAYSANYYALFQLIRSYLTVTKDFAYLQQTINNRTILETLEYFATNWERISSYGKPGCTDDMYKLGDFGDDVWNLLECVPTYKHIVPSFNANYIWMMRETAKFYKMKNNNQKAVELNRKADEMLPRLMKLYAGNGDWKCLYPYNKTAEVRHCMDFIYVARFLADDIPTGIRNEMMQFVDRELRTNTWMRAQSLLDSAAKDSDRPDHGPLGAYDGWPAGTMEAFSMFGKPQEALNFYRAVEPLTHEGSWAQAHELWGDDKENKNARVRIAERGWHARDEMVGVAFSQVMLKSFFGFEPTIDGNAISNSNLPIDFSGTIFNVLYAGKYYNISCNKGVVKMTAQK